MSINTKLLEMAQANVEAMLKAAFTPTQPEPPAGAGSQPLDPAMAAQMDPAASGTAPGQVPPPAGDPAAQQAMAAPSMQQAAPPPEMGGQMPAPDPMLAPPDGMGTPNPQAAGVPQAMGGKPKFDPLTIEYRLYNMQQMLSAIANAMGITIPISALIMPPGTAGAPPAEAALPGGAQDPMSQQQQAQGASGGGGIQPMADAGQAAGPMLQPGKSASEIEAEEEQQFADLMADIMADPDVPKPVKSATDGLFDWDVKFKAPLTVDSSVYTVTSTSAAIAAMLRAQTQGKSNV